MTWSLMEAQQAAQEDRHGEFVDVGCDVCEAVESVLFDRRTGEPWSGIEPCDECGSPAEYRRALDDAWWYGE